MAKCSPKSTHPSVTLSAGMPLAMRRRNLNPDSSISCRSPQIHRPQKANWRATLYPNRTTVEPAMVHRRLWPLSCQLRDRSPGRGPLPACSSPRYFEHGQDDKVWRVLNWLNNLTGAVSGSWFNSMDPDPGAPRHRSGSPLGPGRKFYCFCSSSSSVRPRRTRYGFDRLLSTPNMTADLTLQECRIHLVVQRAPADAPPSCLVDGQAVPYQVDQGAMVTLKNFSSRTIEIHQ